ncbi:MAG: hypothetical protein K8T89_13330, partial [Planctomycetes bacterium]|nr:hypothetical protein [Planctomycetota bacterium]
KVRRCHFIKVLAPQYSESLVQHAQEVARQAGRTYLYRNGSFNKQHWAEGLVRLERIEEGLVGILCTQETCNSFALVPGDKRPRFISRPRQQRVLYYYFLDPQLGLIHVRLQTWAPFTLQVYANGHNWLTQQLVRLGIGFVIKDNAFTQLDEPTKAQLQADRFAKLDWPKILTRYAHQVNPLLGKELARYRLRWVVDQAEYASDLLFKSPAALTGLYQKLVQFATVTFTPKDILGFLGRKWDRRFDGDVHTEVKTDRLLGTRIKHRMTRNWLKMYDKFGLILRVETVINRPREFAVFRTRFHRDGKTSHGFFPMNKDTASLVLYQEQALACNRRYLDALAVVDDPAPAYQELRQLTEPKVVAKRSYAGFNPARREDLRLFAAVLDGDHIARGFRNKDIRAAVFGNDAKSAPRQSAAVGRLVKRLHARHLVAKIPHTRRWRVTPSGRQLLSMAVQLYHQRWPELLAA